MPTCKSASKLKPWRLGDVSLGAECPAFVIAEAGVCHNGLVDIALQMVDVAEDAGADAVKFQMFRACDLVTSAAPTVEYQKTLAGYETQREMLEKLELSYVDWRRIKDRCDQRSILFLATPFSLGDLKRLMTLNPKAIKLASTDLPNVPLLNACLATGRPLILSTGASTAEEIRAAVRLAQQMDALDRLALLHCVSSYPTPLDRINLRAIRALERTFGCPVVGLSDHTMSTQTGAWAVAAGARILEKHFTLDKNGDGPDHAMALDADQLREYIIRVRTVEAALGTGEVGVDFVEKEVRELARRSVVSTTVIPAGKRLTGRMIALKRPGTGIPPDELEKVVGRVAAIDIPGDTVLSWAMLR